MADPPGNFMGPNWVLSAPGGQHVGPMNLAIRDGSHGDYRGSYGMGYIGYGGYHCGSGGGYGGYDGYRGTLFIVDSRAHQRIYGWRPTQDGLKYWKTLVMAMDLLIWNSYDGRGGKSYEQPFDQLSLLNQ